MKRFAMITHARSGSTLLTRALDAHPEVLCAGEIFGRSTRKRRRELRHAVDPLPHKCNPERIRSFDAYFWRHLAPAAAAGCKISIEHTLQFPRIREWVDADRDLLIFHLKRDNKVHAAASSFLAQSLHHWTATSPDDHPTETVAPPPERFAEKLKIYRRADKWAKRLAGDRRRVVVHYHELVTDFPGTLARLWRELGVDPIEVAPSEYKRDPRPLSEKLDNLEEIRRHLADTRWAGQCTEAEGGGLPW